MATLNHILERVETLKNQIRLLNEEYAQRGLPKGRAFSKKMGNLNEAMCRTIDTLESYGRDRILTELSLLNLETGENKYMVTILNHHEIGLFIETLYPGWSILDKKEIPIHHLMDNRIIR